MQKTKRKNKKEAHKWRQMYSNTLLRNGNVQFVWRLQKNVLQFGRDFAALSSAIYLLTQNVEVLRGMQMAVWFVDGFMSREGASLNCVCGPLFGREGSGWRLCVLLPSHTLWPELVEKDLCIRKTILPWVKNNYLTCSCDPLVKKKQTQKAQKKCWQSDREELIFIVFWCSGG